MTHMIYSLDKPKMKVILNQGSQYRTGTNRTDMYTGIETSTFRIGLNTGCIGHILAIPANFRQYRPVQKKVCLFVFFYFIFFLLYIYIYIFLKFCNF